MILGLLFLATCLVIVGFQLSFSRSASQLEAQVIVHSLESSLRLDLLTGNLVMTRDAVRSLVKASRKTDICIRILNPDKQEIAVEGNLDVCLDSRAARESRIVSFSNNDPLLGYTIELSYQPHLLAFQLPPVFLVLLGVVIACTVMAVAILSRSLGRIFERFWGIVQNPNYDLSEGPIVSELVELQSRMKESRRREALVAQEQNQKEKLELVGQIYRQVAHDIRAPLAALNMIVRSFNDLSDEKRQLIKNASQRINDIAANLLAQQSRSNTLEPQSALPAEVIQSIIDEKRLRYQDSSNIVIKPKLSDSLDGTRVPIRPSALARVLSNLVDNAVEALESSGSVFLEASDEGARIRISVVDTGPGIPPEILARLGMPGVTFGKSGTQSGSGLGIYHAKSTVEASGGEFVIESKCRIGTRVSLFLPKSAPQTSA